MHPGGWSPAVRGDGNNSRPRQMEFSRMLNDGDPVPERGSQIGPLHGHCFFFYSSKSAPDDQARILAYARLRELNADYVIYSDGSADGGTEKGGAGVVVTIGEPEDPHVVTTMMKKGSILTSSYGEESTAMHMALEDHSLRGGTKRVKAMTSETHRREGKSW